MDLHNLESPSNQRWNISACHKDPHRLYQLTQPSLAAMVATSATQHQTQNELRKIGDILKSSLPVDVRTAILKDVSSVCDIVDRQHLKTLLQLHLLADVKHIRLTAGLRSVHLEQDDCDSILEGIVDIKEFQIETLSMEGITMEEGLLSTILARCPRLRSIHVSGDVANEVLDHLQEQPCSLHSLQLDSCTVSDEDVVRAVVGSYSDFHSLANSICSSGNATQLRPAALNSLRHLSVESPMLSVGGAVVLLSTLKNLRQFEYTAWNTPISDILQFLHKVAPESDPVSLTSLAQWRPTEYALKTLVTLCPGLKRLMIECYDPTLTALDVLAGFSQLSKLNLRLVSEDLIVSAVKALGENLLELELEFEEYTYHSISVDTIKAIQTCCPYLQRLEMKHVNIWTKQGEPMFRNSAVVFPELKELKLSSAVIQPAVLERLVVGNSSLERLALDVNQDALTDPVLTGLLKNNHLHRLQDVFLGAGSVSAHTITKLLALPALIRLSLNLKRFPFIPISTFTALEDTLVRGNFKCVLENVTNDD